MALSMFTPQNMQLLPSSAYLPQHSTPSWQVPNDGVAASYSQHESAAPLEEGYAEIMAQVLRDEISTPEAVGKLEGLCQDNATEMREFASSSIHRPARHMHLQNLAQEFEAQAATWHLLISLYCSEDNPAGDGGPPVAGSSIKKTARHHLAERTNMHQSTHRCAAVVSWLESLAQDALESGPAPRFANDAVVWSTTKAVLGQPKYVSELDPDAPSRQHASLHEHNAKDEEQFLQRVWQLLRAGMYTAAIDLCRKCGQPWRAASIAGPAGLYGPLPVGTQAFDCVSDLTPAQQAEDFASEVELGGVAGPRGLWKWSCLQVALQSSSRYEKAIYGLLCGHLPSILPLCSSWKDQLWAHCRVWMDAAADVDLAEEHAAALNNSQAAPLDLGCDDAILDVITRFAGQSQGADALRGALAAVQGQAPGVRREGPGALASTLLTSFDNIFGSLKASQVPSVAAAANDPFHQVQQFLIQDDMSGLADYLHRWLSSPLKAGTGALGAGDEEVYEGVPSYAMRMHCFAAHLVLVLEGLGKLYTESTLSTQDTARISKASVHLLVDRVLSEYVSKMMDRGLFELVPQYLCHLDVNMRTCLVHEMLTALTQKLAEAARKLPLPPGYVPATPSPDLQAADDLCRRVFLNLIAWFEHCVDRQHRKDQFGWSAVDALGAPDMGMLPDPSEYDTAPVRSNMDTSIRPNELLEHVNQFIDSVRLKTAPRAAVNAPPPQTSQPDGDAAATATPGQAAPQVVEVGYDALSRAVALRWLFYHETPAELRQAITPNPLPEEHLSAATAWVIDSLSASLGVLSDLALGDDAAAHAAVLLLLNIMPKGYLPDVLDLRDELHQKALDYQARTAAAAQGAHYDPMATEDMEAAQLQQQSASQLAATLSPLVTEVQHWQAYFELRQVAKAWLANVDKLQAQPGSPGFGSATQGMRQDGAQLLERMQAQLLCPTWMSGIGQPAQQVQHNSPQEALESVEVHIVVTQPGNTMATPTVPAALSLATVPAQASAPLHSTAYPLLKGGTVLIMAQQLEEGMRQAMSSLHGSRSRRPAAASVHADVIRPDEAKGHLAVKLRATPNKQGVVDIMALASSVIQGSLPGVPQVLLVNLLAERPMAAAICTRCCLAQVAVTCAQIRYKLTCLGGRGSEGEQLAALLATGQMQEGVVGVARLADVLNPAQLGEIMSLEAETSVQLMMHQQLQDSR